MTDSSAKEAAGKNQYNISQLSGFEILQLIIEGKIRIPIAETMGQRLVKIDKGYALFEAKPDARHLGPFGAVHGGFVATVLDSVVSCAVITLLEPGVLQVVVDLNGTLYAHATATCMILR